MSKLRIFFSSHKNRVVQRLPIPVIGYRCNGSLEQLRQISLVLFWNTTKIKRFMLNLILSRMKNHNFIRKPRTYVVFPFFLCFFIFSQYINKWKAKNRTDFEAFCLVITSSINLLFLKGNFFCNQFSY